jgi:hypothetical protein
MGDANGLHHGGRVFSLIVLIDKHKHHCLFFWNIYSGLCRQVCTMKFIVTCWTKVNMAYQTLLGLLAILLQGFTEVFPVLFIMFIMEFVVAPLTESSTRCRYPIVPHAVKSMAKISSCQGSLCNSHCHIPSPNCLSSHTLPPHVLPDQTKQTSKLITHELMFCSPSSLYQRLRSLICPGK